MIYRMTAMDPDALPPLIPVDLEIAPRPPAPPPPAPYAAISPLKMTEQSILPPPMLPPIAGGGSPTITPDTNDMSILRKIGKTVGTVARATAPLAGVAIPGAGGIAAGIGARLLS